MTGSFLKLLQRITIPYSTWALGTTELTELRTFTLGTGKHMVMNFLMANRLMEPGATLHGWITMDSLTYTLMENLTGSLTTVPFQLLPLILQP